MKKINWGVGIVIAFGLFMTFILSFVFRVQSSPEYDNELVVDNYYQHDTKYGEVLEKQQRALELAEKPIINSQPNGVSISFPEAWRSKIQSGKVSLYRPSNKKLDFGVPLNPSGAALLIPDSRLVGGLWDITIEFRMENQDYIVKQELYR